MAWKKYFKDANMSPIAGDRNPQFAKRNYSSYLPDVYTGHPNRIQRYFQYDQMDSDSEVNAALDILAEFCTQANKENETPFDIVFKGEVIDSEVKLLKKALQQWTKSNKFQKRVFRIFRNVMKYGDCFFVRDTETQRWLYIDPAKVDRIIVNESEGKKPEQYIVKDINLNFIDNVATTPYTTNGNVTGGGDGYLTGGVRGMVGNTQTSGSSGGRFGHDKTKEHAISAEHMVHLSLSEGLDNNAPFGNSLLEGIFKVYKQKELLEDAIIIYRTQRAPERRVFYVDVGNMPSHLAMQFVERVKTEIHQRRIPSKTGGGTSVIDSAYNPLSTNEDYFFPQTAEGRGSKVETLPGGTNLGEIDDLKYFTNKLVRGLRIPSSYLPAAAQDEGQSSFNDGRVGTAYIQELRFNKYCERLQNLIAEVFNQEFKRYLLEKGINVDIAMFDLLFQPPQNFASYRQSELDNQRIGTFAQIQAIPFISNRYAMKRFLGMSDSEVAENERYWREENDETLSSQPTDASAEMRGAGISGAGIEADLGAGADTAPEGEEGVATGETEGPESVTTPPAGGGDAGGETPPA